MYSILEKNYKNEFISIYREKFFKGLGVRYPSIITQSLPSQLLQLRERERGSEGGREGDAERNAERNAHTHTHKKMLYFLGSSKNSTIPLCTKPPFTATPGVVPDMTSKHPVEFFNLMFSQDIKELIHEQSNLYAQQYMMKEKH